MTTILNQTKSQNPSKWTLENDGHIKWMVEENDSHTDHIKISGFQISTIVHYGVKEGRLKQKIHLVFPLLRTLPNDTHASLTYKVDCDTIPPVKIDGIPLEEQPEAFYLRVCLNLQIIQNQWVK